MLSGQMPSSRIVGAFFGAFVSLLAVPALGAEDPTPHAVRKLVERTRGALVRVVSRPAGTAILVGVGGELIAADSLVRNGALIIEHNGKRLAARLLARDRKLGVALLALASGQYPAATVGSASALRAGDFLIGMSFDRNGDLAIGTGHFERLLEANGTSLIRADVACGANAALFNSRGELVAVRVASKRSTVSIESIRASLGAKERD